VELKDYVKILRARKWLVIVPVLVLTVGAGVMSLLETPAYQGVAEIVVSPADAGLTMLGAPQPDTYQPGRDEVDTQVEVILSRRIAGMVIEQLRLDESVDQLLGRVSASADTGTSIITLRATDESSARAADIANAFVQTYIVWTRDQQRESITAAAKDVEARLAEAQEQIEKIAEETPPGDRVGAADQVRLDAARERYAGLSSKLEELLIAERLSTGKGSLLAPATADPAPVSPNPRRSVVLGLALGLLVGLGLVILAEELDTKLKSSDEAGDVCDARVLATIPLDRTRSATPERLVGTENATGSTAQAYWMLRTNLDFLNIDKRLKTVLITSAVPGEGKSTVAANLATVLAQSGESVVLVVCDFHLPTMDRFFETDGSIGLSDVLRSGANPWLAARKPQGIDKLWVLSPGLMPPSTNELLGSEAMGKLIENLRASVDWVILDSAPALARADAASVSRWVDGVLMVTRVGMSRRDEAHSGCEQLKNVGARLLGLVVLGPVDVSNTRGYRGYSDEPSK
jgi:capsular exopolysaccharide synthesis family protein